MPDNSVQFGVHNFVRRQTAQSSHDHFDGSWDELLELIQSNWSRRKVSPSNSQVMLVPMPNDLVHRFYTSLIPIQPDTELKAAYAIRQEGEEPFVRISATPQKNQPLKQAAQRVDIILYSHEVLAQDNDAPDPKEADFYVIAINAYPTETPAPMNPMTMARNFLNMDGGTKPDTPYTAEDFAKAIVYWNQHVHLSDHE